MLELASLSSSQSLSLSEEIDVVVLSIGSIGCLVGFVVGETLSIASSCFDGCVLGWIVISDENGLKVVGKSVLRTVLFPLGDKEGVESKPSSNGFDGLIVGTEVGCKLTGTGIWFTQPKSEAKSIFRGVFDDGSYEGSLDEKGCEGCDGCADG